MVLIFSGKTGHVDKSYKSCIEHPNGGNTNLILYGTLQINYINWGEITIYLTH